MANLNIAIEILAKDQASGTLGRITNSLSGLGTGLSGLKTVGVAALGAVAAGAGAAGLAVGGFAVSSINAAAEMEQQVANIAAVMGATKDEIAPLNDLIKDLGLNPNLKVTAVEAGQAIEMLAKNGLSLEQVMAGAAESTVLLANATGADFATAADIGTDAMAIFKINAEDMMDAVNGITSVTTGSKFDINDYALALAQGGGVASAAGVSFEDFNTTIAAISPLFKSGSDAGTSLKTMLTRLTGSTGPAADAMAELGIITEDGANQFFTAEGQMRSMGEIAGILQSTLSGLSDEQRTNALQAIFGADAMRAAVGLMEVGEEGFASLMTQMSQTDALESAATRMDTLSGTMEVIEGVIDTLKLSFGQALLPAVRAVADTILGFADGALPKIEAGMGKAAGAVTEFISALGAGKNPLEAIGHAFYSISESDQVFVLLDETIYPLIATIAELKDRVLEFITPIANAIAQFVSWQDVLVVLGGIVAAVVLPALWGIVTAAAPVIAVGAALVAAVALVRNAWENDWGGIRTAILNAWDTSIRPALEQLWQWLSVNVPIALETLRAWWVDVAWPAIGAALQTAWSVISFVLTAMWDSLVNIIIPALASLWDYWVNVAWPAISTALQNAWAFIQPILLNIQTFIVTTLIPAVQNLYTQWTTVWWPTIQTVLENVWTVMSAIFEEIGRWVNDNIVPWVEHLYTQWTSVWWPAIQAAVETMWAAVEPIFTVVVEWLQDNIPVAIEAVRGAFETAMSAISTAIEPARTAIDGIKSAAEGFWNWITSHTFDFKISIPDLPKWAVPGSPLPIHTAWADFARDMRNVTIAPQMSVDGVDGVGLGTLPRGGSNSHTINNYYLQADYRMQDERSLRDDVRMLQLLTG